MKFHSNTTPPPDGIVAKLDGHVLLLWKGTGLNPHYCCHGWCETCWSFECNNIWHNRYACPHHWFLRMIFPWDRVPDYFFKDVL